MDDKLQEDISTDDKEETELVNAEKQKKEHHLHQDLPNTQSTQELNPHTLNRLTSGLGYTRVKM